jgi:hypothetical protein
MASFPLKELFKSKHKDNYKIIINGWISPDCDTIFGKNICSFDCPKFGKYCEFKIIINKPCEKHERTTIWITDKNRKFYVRPTRGIEYYNAKDEDFLVAEWTGEGFYDCNRTYFHFEDSDDNTSGEADFAHYKCKYIDSSLSKYK